MLTFGTGLILYVEEHSTTSGFVWRRATETDLQHLQPEIRDGGRFREERHGILDTKDGRRYYTERAGMENALLELSLTNLNEGNCSSLAVASSRVRALAKRGLGAPDAAALGDRDAARELLTQAEGRAAHRRASAESTKATLG